MSDGVTVFIFVEDEAECIVKVFADPNKALEFAIPFVAEKVGYTLTGDNNVDWDVLNTETEHPGYQWFLQYSLPVE